MSVAMTLPTGMRMGGARAASGHSTYSDDAELVAALHRGERAARTILVQRYEPLVERLVAGALGIDAEIPDVVQDVFVGVFEGIRSLKDASALRSSIATPPSSRRAAASAGGGAGAGSGSWRPKRSPRCRSAARRGRRTRRCGPPTACSIRSRRTNEWRSRCASCRRCSSPRWRPPVGFRWRRSSAGWRGPRSASSRPRAAHPALRERLDDGEHRGSREQQSRIAHARRRARGGRARRPSPRHPAQGIERRARHARPATPAGRGALGLRRSPGPPPAPPRWGWCSLRPVPLSYSVSTAVESGERGTVGGNRLVGPATGALALKFSDGSEVTGDARTGARRRARRPRRDALGRGRHDRGLRVHRAHTRWDVRAGRYWIHVTGTKFSAGWDPHERSLTVTMHEGSVAVSGPGLKQPMRVVTGQRLRANMGADPGVEEPVVSIDDANAPEAAAAPTAGATAQTIRELPATRAVPEPPAPPAERPAPARELHAAGPGRGSRHPVAAPQTVARAEPTWRLQATHGQYADALASAIRDGWGESCARLGSEDVVMLGDIARLAGDRGRAEEAYRTASRRFPTANRPIYYLGLIAFDGHHDYAAAARLFGEYLAGSRAGRWRARRRGGCSRPSSRPERWVSRARPRRATCARTRTALTPLWRAVRSVRDPCARGGRFIKVLLAALLVTLFAGAAQAAPDKPGPRPRVVLLGATLDNPLGGRVAAELESMGLSVTRLVIAPAFPIEDQVRQAFISGARAAVVADGHRTEFWVAWRRAPTAWPCGRSSKSRPRPASNPCSRSGPSVLRVSLGLRNLRARAAAAAGRDRPATARRDRAPFFRRARSGRDGQHRAARGLPDHRRRSAARGSWGQSASSSAATRPSATRRCRSSTVKSTQPCGWPGAVWSSRRGPSSASPPKRALE